MEACTKESGNLARKTVKESFIGLMGRFMRENSKITNATDKESYTTSVVRGLKVSGRVEKRMEDVFTRGLTELATQSSILMESAKVKALLKVLILALNNSRISISH